MAIYKQDIVDVDLNTGSIFRSFMSRTLGEGDDMADRFGVRLFRNGESVNVEDSEVIGLFMAPNGVNFLISETTYTGSTGKSGNVAWVQLPDDCYVEEGNFSLAIKLSGGSVVGTMRIVDGVVSNTGSTGAVAPTGSIPSSAEIIAAFEAATELIDGVVRHDVTQSISAIGKAKARSNIGAVSQSDYDTVTGKVGNILRLGVEASSDQVSGTNMLSSFTIGTNAIGYTGLPYRAISNAMPFTGESINVEITSIADDIYVEFEWYTEETLNSDNYIGSDGGWKKQSGSYYNYNANYCRLLLGNLNGDDITTEDLENTAITVTKAKPCMIDLISRNNSIVPYNKQIEYVIGKNAAHLNDARRAITEPIYAMGQEVVVVADLPSNIKIEGEWYSDGFIRADSYVGSQGGWKTEDGTYTYRQASNAKYFAVLVGTIDDSDMPSNIASILGLQIIVRKPVKDDIEEVNEYYGSGAYQALDDTDDVMYDMKADGTTSGIRALSKVFRISSESDLKVNIVDVPEDVNYEFEFYRTEDPATFENSSGGWNDDTASGEYTYPNPNRCEFIRVLFRNADNTSHITPELLEGMDIRIFVIGGTPAGSLLDSIRKAVAKETTIITTDSLVPMRICSYNVENYSMTPLNPNVNKLEHYKKFIAENKFDIMFLQENYGYISGVDVNTNVYDPLFKYSVGTNANINTAIKSSYSFVTYGTIGRSRPWSYAVVKIRGKNVLIMSVHFDIFEPGWESDFAFLASFLQDYSSFIVAGDFNTANSAYSDEAAQARINQFKTLGYTVANGGYLGLRHTQHSEMALDNVITSSDIIIRNSKPFPEEYGNLFSDHYPFVADLLI